MLDCLDWFPWCFDCFDCSDSFDCLCFWFAGEFHVSAQLRFGCICGILFDCFGFLQLFGIIFWVSGASWGPLGIILACFLGPSGPWGSAPCHVSFVGLGSTCGSVYLVVVGTALFAF